MKKFGIIAGFVGLVGSVAASMIASAGWFNQPKTPSMLKK